MDLPITANWPSNGHSATRARPRSGSVRVLSECRGRSADPGARGQSVAEVSRRLGIEPGPDPDAGFVLGSFSTNVMSMTAAYASVANGGYRVAPTGVLAVVDGRGQVRASFLEPTQDADHPAAVYRADTSRCCERSSGPGLDSMLLWAGGGLTARRAPRRDTRMRGFSAGVRAGCSGIWMGKRRDAEGGLLAGKDAPADYFRRVSTSANEMMDYRPAQERNKGPSRTATAGVARSTAQRW